MRLFWTDLGDAKITKFQHRYRVNTDGSGWEPGATEGWADISGSSATTMDHTVTGLASGGDGYVFEVRAISDAGNGDASSARATPTGVARAPSQMSNVQHTVSGVSGGSGGNVKFTWDDPGENFIGKYQYRYDGESGNPGAGNWDQDWKDFLVSSATTTSYPSSADGPVRIPGSSATVYFQFQAVNTNAEPDISGRQQPLPSPETTPTVKRPRRRRPRPGFSAAPAWDGTSLTWYVRLTWDAAADDTTIDKYERRHSIDIGVTYGEWTRVFGDGAAIDAVTESLTAGTTYTFQLRGVDEDVDPDVNGAASSPNVVTPGQPNPPNSLTVEPVSDNTETTNLDESQTQLKLTWTDGLAANGVTVSGYRCRQRVSGGTEWGDWAAITGADFGTQETATITGLSVGRTYDVRVQTMAGSIGSDPSNTGTGTTAGAAYMPDVPNGVTATPNHRRRGPHLDPTCGR